MLDLLSAIREVNTHLNPDAQITLTIENAGTGSFWFDVAGALVSGLQTTISSPESIQTVFNCFEDLLRLFNHLGGEEPKAVKDTEVGTKIVNQQGEASLFAPNVFTIYGDNNNLHFNLAGAMSKAASDPSIKAITIGTTDNEAIQIPHARFPMLATIKEPESIIVEHEKDRMTTISNAHLVLATAVLAGNRRKKWEFYYGEHRIKAQIKDKAFFETIENGELFGKGDTLTVTLEIHKKFDKSLNLLVPSKYIVQQITGHRHRPEQTGML